MVRYPNLEVFAPNRYSYNTYNYTGVGGNLKVLPRNNRRVWFSVRRTGFAVVPFPLVFFDGVSTTSPVLPFIDPGVSIFSWSDHYVLVQSEIYLQLGVGPVDVQIIEQTINETRTEDNKRANDLLRLAEAKVESISRWRGRGIYSGRSIDNTGKPEASKYNYTK